jgi:hypothetical protein
MYVVVGWIAIGACKAGWTTDFYQANARNPLLLLRCLCMDISAEGNAVRIHRFPALGRSGVLPSCVGSSSLFRMARCERAGHCLCRCHAPPGPLSLAELAVRHLRSCSDGSAP